MKCKRCNREIETDAPVDAVICGSCADDLRQEEDAILASLSAEEEEIMFQMDKDAYEETLRKGESEYQHI